MAVRGNRAINLLLRSLGKCQETSFTSHVRAHLELNIQIYPPILSKDNLVLERVQWRATKRVKGLSGKSYPERLKTLNLFSLAFRRLRGYMILMHKIPTDLDHPNKSILTLREDECLRSHSLIPLKPGIRTKLCSNAFPAHVPFTWNRLPADFVKPLLQRPLNASWRACPLQRWDRNESPFYNRRCSASDAWASARPCLVSFLSFLLQAYQYSIDLCFLSVVAFPHSPLSIFLTFSLFFRYFGFPISLQLRKPMIVM